MSAAAAVAQSREARLENEEEMFWRGQQIAFAIKRYRRLRGGMLPTDLKELVQGIDVGGKKIHLLRPVALCDPLMPCPDGTNWRLVHPGDPLLKELLDGIVAFQKMHWIPVSPHSIEELSRFAQNESATLPDGRKEPIIGVVSRKRGIMFKPYYGIKRYDHALFFSGIPDFRDFIFVTKKPGAASWRRILAPHPGAASANQRRAR